MRLPGSDRQHIEDLGMAESVLRNDWASSGRPDKQSPYVKEPRNGSLLPRAFGNLTESHRLDHSAYVPIFRDDPARHKDILSTTGPVVGAQQGRKLAYAPIMELGDW